MFVPGDVFCSEKLEAGLMFSGVFVSAEETQTVQETDMILYSRVAETCS